MSSATVQRKTMLMSRLVMTPVAGFDVRRAFFVKRLCSAKRNAFASAKNSAGHGSSFVPCYGEKGKRRLLQSGKRPLKCQCDEEPHGDSLDQRPKSRRGSGVKAGARRRPGVQSIDFNLERSVAVVEFKGEHTIVDDLMRAVLKAGYQLV
jgi:hypothetical protein